ncbi:hypothetical protein B0H11DRAFT_2052916, partial [Mycena galericulata]
PSASPPAMSFEAAAASIVAIFLSSWAYTQWLRPILRGNHDRLPLPLLNRGLSLVTYKICQLMDVSGIFMRPLHRNSRATLFTCVCWEPRFYPSVLFLLPMNCLINEGPSGLIGTVFSCFTSTPPMKFYPNLDCPS